MTQAKTAIKEAAENEQAEQAPKYQTIEINGQKAVLLAGSAFDGVPLSIAPTSVLKYMKSLLPTTTLDEIKQQAIDRLIETQSMKEFIAEMTEILAFHKSINMMEEYFLDDEKKTMKAVPSVESAGLGRKGNDDGPTAYTH